MDPSVLSNLYKALCSPAKPRTANGLTQRVSNFLKFGVGSLLNTNCPFYSGFCPLIPWSYRSFCRSLVLSNAPYESLLMPVRSFIKSQTFWYIALSAGSGNKRGSFFDGIFTIITRYASWFPSRRSIPKNILTGEYPKYSIYRVLTLGVYFLPASS